MTKMSTFRLWLRPISRTLDASGVLLTILKITGQLDWSWWWITFPFWIFYALAILLLLPWALKKSVDLLALKVFRPIKDGINKRKNES